MNKDDKVYKIKKWGNSAKGLRQTSRTDNLANRKLIVINCQSLLSKKDLFSYFVSNHNPDFVVGSESWLSHSILNSKVFPSNFTVFRKTEMEGMMECL